MKHDKITVGSIHDTTSLKMGLNGDGGGGYLIISRKFLTNIIFSVYIVNSSSRVFLTKKANLFFDAENTISLKL